MAIIGVVLAAGAGTRFEGPKALAVFRGRRLVDRAVTTLRSGGCDDVLVVSGAVDLGDVQGASVVSNPEWQTGMAGSLRVAFHAAAASHAEAVVVLLVDQPLIGSESVARVIRAHRRGARVAAATYAGERGHPILFDGMLLDEIVPHLVGDQGARSYLAAHPEIVVPVPCDGTGSAADADTPEALEALEALESLTLSDPGRSDGSDSGAAAPPG